MVETSFHIQQCHIYLMKLSLIGVGIWLGICRSFFLIKNSKSYLELLLQKMCTSDDTVTPTIKLRNDLKLEARTKFGDFLEKGCELPTISGRPFFFNADSSFEKLSSMSCFDRSMDRSHMCPNFLR